ncbi:MAG: hypothetical protein JOZ88_00040, partial [Hyphomicrobiales bacterium]|nr:hypothetical protein [Hyphomicrobiales bacterium]
ADLSGALHARQSERPDRARHERHRDDRRCLALGRAAPLGAILDDGKGANVFVIDPQTKELVRRPVVIAGYDAQDAIISSGLAEGDAVIALGVQKLHDGDAVRPVNGAGA